MGIRVEFGILLTNLYQHDISGTFPMCNGVFICNTNIVNKSIKLTIIQTSYYPSRQAKFVHRFIPVIIQVYIVTHQVATVAAVIGTLIATGIFTLLVIHCRNKNGDLHHNNCVRGQMNASKQNGADKPNHYLPANPKLNNLDKGLVST